MITRDWRRQLPLMLSLSLLLCSLTVQAQQPRGRTTAPSRPAASDFKLTEKTVQSGQTYESATLIKGARQRSEMNVGHGQSSVSIMQCDLKRTIQINDQTRKYMITPMAGGEAGGSTDGSQPAAPATTQPGARTGGVVTYVTNINDTGERKEMFGLTARHVKSSFSIEPSADACMKDQMRIDRDGWYVDLQYGLECAVSAAAQTGMRSPQAGGCRDQIRHKSTGTGKLGFPLMETTTIYGANGMQMSSSSKEVIELSRQPLEAALFELPAGYTEATNYQEMYAPAMGDTQAKGINPVQHSEGAVTPGTPATKSGLRIGVVPINNKTDKSISSESLRDRLVAEIIGDGIEAIPLNALSPAAAEAEAKARQCDFILYTDISALKTASAGKKLGGMFGRAAGVNTGDIGKTESRLDFKLFPTGSSTALLTSSATGKEEGDEASVGAALDREAQAVTAAVRKR